MRCHDGREPLDFASDSAVRQLLLAEVEKLRMGLLDELLADEGEGGGGGGKGGKGGGKAAKGKNKAHKKGKDPPKGDEGVDGHGADAAGKPDGVEADGTASLSKAAKKKQKKAKGANGPENGTTEAPAAALAAASAAENTSQGQRPGTEGAAPRHPTKKSPKAASKGDGPSQLREAAVHVLDGQASST